MGAIALRALRTRAIGTQVAALALTTVVSTAVGSYAAARAMFFSEHDLAALGVVLVAAGTTGVVAALVMGTRIGDASAALVRVARRIGDAPAGGHLPDGPEGGGS
jgi:hypothetical protein